MRNVTVKRTGQELEVSESEYLDLVRQGLVERQDDTDEAAPAGDPEPEPKRLEHKPKPSRSEVITTDAAPAPDKQEG
jgi:hypothetical protein